MRPALRTLVAVLAIIPALPALAAAETWVIDPDHTVAGFSVRHMMITKVTGVFEVTRGTIEYTPGDASSVKADVAIETKSVNSGTSAATTT